MLVRLPATDGRPDPVHVTGPVRPQLHLRFGDPSG